ncbi:MAG: terpene cyclase/mutase family protein [Planctomycetes bacterium]|nr:terpene cyclase/mutase family protein [Planctomycetota bacterium]
MQLRHVAAAAAIAVGLLLSSSAVVAKPKPKEDKKEEKKEYTQEQINKHIVAALEWFVDHQSPDGSWSVKDFSSHSARPRAKKTYNLAWVKAGEENGDAGYAENNDVAATALVLLTFTGMGYDHTEGAYKEYCSKGLAHLLSQQGETGCFGDTNAMGLMYEHAIATMAVTEMYGLSGDEKLKAPAEKAVAYLLDAQNDNGGWRWSPNMDSSDNQFTGWAILGLKSAKMSAIDGNYDAAFEAADAWFTKTTGDVDGIMKTGFDQPGGNDARVRASAGFPAHPCPDAAHVLFRLFSGDKKWGVKNKDLKKQADRCLADLPKWEDKQVDFQYWYFATLMEYQYGGKDWEKWRDALLPALLENQRGWAAGDEDTFEAILDEHGSWDAVGAWCPQGGRVWSTATSTLMLQVAARYMRLEDK